MSPDLVRSCAKRECTIGAGDGCFDGVAEPEQCPHYLVGSRTNDVDSVSSQNVQRETLAPKQTDIGGKVSLPGTDEFTMASAAEITLAYVTRLIVIAGEGNSGKTTLLASFIDRFQKGPFSGYRFAGCKTLMGFEQRCHLARLKSGGTRPDTEVTHPSVGLKLLHLTVRSIERDHLIQDLLFTDVSGETFRLAKDFVEETRRLEFLHRADRFVLLVDGEKLASRTRREEAYQGSILILRRCVETGMLDKHSFVDVVFTKIDLIENSEKDLRTSDFLQLIETRIRDRYEESLGRLRVFTVDARHLSNSSPSNQLPALFSSWVVETPLYDLRYYDSTRIPLTSKREFDRYLVRSSYGHDLEV